MKKCCGTRDPSCPRTGDVAQPGNISSASDWLGPPKASHPGPPTASQGLSKPPRACQSFPGPAASKIASGDNMHMKDIQHAFMLVPAVYFAPTKSQDGSKTAARGPKPKPRLHKMPLMWPLEAPRCLPDRPILPTKAPRCPARGCKTTP